MTMIFHSTRITRIHLVLCFIFHGAWIHFMFHLAFHTTWIAGIHLMSFHRTRVARIHLVPFHRTRVMILHVFLHCTGVTWIVFHIALHRAWVTRVHLLVRKCRCRCQAHRQQNSCCQCCDLLHSLSPLSQVGVMNSLSRHDMYFLTITPDEVTKSPPMGALMTSYEIITPDNNNHTSVITTRLKSMPQYRISRYHPGK